MSYVAGLFLAISPPGSLVYCAAVKKLLEAVHDEPSSLDESHDLVKILFQSLSGNEIVDIHLTLPYLPNLFAHSPESDEFQRLRMTLLDGHSVGLYPILCNQMGNPDESAFGTPAVATELYEYILGLMVDLPPTENPDAVRLLLIEFLLMHCLGECCRAVLNIAEGQLSVFREAVMRAMSPTMLDHAVASDEGYLVTFAAVRALLFCKYKNEELILACYKAVIEQPNVEVKSSDLLKGLQTPINENIEDLVERINLLKTYGIIDDNSKGVMSLSYIRDQLSFHGCRELTPDLQVILYKLKGYLFHRDSALRLKARSIAERFEIPLEFVDMIALSIDGIVSNSVNADNIESIALLIGCTGSGKSTVTNALYGVRLIHKEHPVNYTTYLDVDPKSPIKPVATVGHGWSSKTLYPQLVTLPSRVTKGLIGLVDCPGSGDNREGHMRLCADMGVPLAIAYGRDVSAMVITIEEVATQGRGDTLRSIFQDLAATFEHPEIYFAELSKLTVCPLLFAITKISNNLQRLSPNETRKVIYNRVRGMQRNSQMRHMHIEALEKSIEQLKQQSRSMNAKHNRLMQDGCENLEKEVLEREMYQNAQEIDQNLKELRNLRGEVLVLNLLCSQESNIFILNCIHGHLDHKEELMQRLSQLSKSDIRIQKSAFKFNNFSDTFIHVKQQVDRLASSIMPSGVKFAECFSALGAAEININNQKAVIEDCERELKEILQSATRAKNLVEKAIRNKKGSVEFFKELLDRKRFQKARILKQKCDLENAPLVEYKSYIRVGSYWTLGRLVGFNYLFPANHSFELDDESIIIEKVELSCTVCVDEKRDKNALVLKSKMNETDPNYSYVLQGKAIVDSNVKTNVIAQSSSENIVVIQPDENRGERACGEFRIIRENLAGGFVSIRYKMQPGEYDKSCSFRVFVKPLCLPDSRRQVVEWINALDSLHVEMRILEENIRIQENYMHEDEEYLEALSSVGNSQSIPELLEATFSPSKDVLDSLHRESPGIYLRIEGLLLQLGPMGKSILRETLGINAIEASIKEWLCYDHPYNAETLRSLASFYDTHSDTLKQMTSMTRKQYFDIVLGQEPENVVCDQSFAAVCRKLPNNVFAALHSIRKRCKLSFLTILKILAIDRDEELNYVDLLRNLELERFIHNILCLRYQNQLKPLRFRYRTYNFLHELCQRRLENRMEDGTVNEEEGLHKWWDGEKVATFFCPLPETLTSPILSSFSLTIQDMDAFSNCFACLKPSISNRSFKDYDFHEALLKVCESHNVKIDDVVKIFAGQLAKNENIETMNVNRSEISEFMIGVNEILLLRSSIQSKKPVWLVVGNIGSGKSSLLNKMCGIEYTPNVDSITEEYFLVPTSKEFSVSARSKGYSVTAVPVVVEGSDSVFVDMPGFCAPHLQSRLQKYFLEFATTYVLQVAPSVGNIIFTISWDEIMTSRTNRSICIFDQLFSWYGDIIERQPELLSIAFTNVPTDQNFESLLVKLTGWFEVVHRSLLELEWISQHDHTEHYKSSMNQLRLILRFEVLLRRENQSVLIFFRDGALTQVNEPFNASICPLELVSSPPMAIDCMRFINRVTSSYAMESKKLFMFRDQCKMSEDAMKTITDELKTIKTLTRAMHGENMKCEEIVANLAEFGLHMEEEEKVAYKFLQELQSQQTRYQDSITEKQNILIAYEKELHMLNERASAEVFYRSKVYEFKRNTWVKPILTKIIAAGGAIVVGAAAGLGVGPAAVPIAAGIFCGIEQQIPALLKYATAQTITFSSTNGIPVARIDKHGTHGIFGSDTFSYDATTNSYSIVYYPFADQQGEVIDTVDTVQLHIFVEKQHLDRDEVATLKSSIAKLRVQIELHKEMLKTLSEQMVEFRKTKFSLEEWPTNEPKLKEYIRNKQKQKVLCELSYLQYKEMKNVQKLKFDSFYQDWNTFQKSLSGVPNVPKTSG